MISETLETQHMADLRQSIESEITEHRRWYALQGIAFILIGVLAITLPGITAMGFELLIGALLLSSGIVKAFASVRSKTHWWSLLSSLVLIIFGGLLLFKPVAGILALATLLTLFLAIEGTTELLLSFKFRPAKNWGWLMFSGLVSLGLAFLLFAGWPEVTVAVLGIFIGISLLLYGLSLLAITTQGKSSA